MARPRILGFPQPQRQSLEITYDPTQGWQTTEEFASAGDNLGPLANFYARRGASLRLRANPIRSTLVATASRNNFAVEVPVERWELLTNTMMLDIREHPNVVNNLTQAELAQVLKDQKRHEIGKTVDTSAYTSTQLSLFNHLIRGVTHYQIYQWVLRYTANVSDQYNFFTVANSGIGSIFTTSQVVAVLPSGRLASMIQAITPPPFDPELVWGWMKVAIGETTAARSRVESSAEFHLANWSALLYT